MSPIEWLASSSGQRKSQKSAYWRCELEEAIGA